MIQNSGSQVVASGTDVAVGVSGKATRVFSINFVSGATAGVVLLRNGTSASGTAYIREDGVISSGKTASYGQTGILFPGGCFCDVDANVTAAVISYAQEG